MDLAYRLHRVIVLSAARVERSGRWKLKIRVSQPVMHADWSPTCESTPDPCMGAHCLVVTSGAHTHQSLHGTVGDSTDSPQAQRLDRLHRVLRTVVNSSRRVLEHFRGAYEL